MDIPDLISYGSDYVKNMVDPPQQLDSAIPSPMLQPGMTDFTALLKANQDKNFIQRILNPDQYPKINNPDGGYSTHLMSYVTNDQGQAHVFPTIIQRPDNGELHKFENPMDAWNYAKQSGEFITMPAAQADMFTNEKASAYKAYLGAGKL